ncbi:hypothetical protein H483_0110395 [Dietzia sp. UCD-THP]|nr:hypothetical protein H483_0110395 [Dietzia sp. UCD-THP]
MSDWFVSIRSMKWIDFVEFARMMMPARWRRPLKLLLIFMCLLAPTYVAWWVGLYGEAHAQRLLDIVVSTLLPTVAPH